MNGCFDGIYYRASEVMLSNSMYRTVGARLFFVTFLIEVIYLPKTVLFWTWLNAFALESACFKSDKLHVITVHS